MQPETLIFKDDGETPNSRLPLLVYKGVLGNALPGTADRDLAVACENLFEKNGWPPAWRASVHPFSHFHTRCHEALGVVRGSGRVQFGGASGRTVTCEAGDVVVLPAGDWDEGLLPLAYDERSILRAEESGAIRRRAEKAIRRDTDETR